jgi:hypothetical protein
MITPEEFRDLTDSLEGIGHYDPSVEDLMRHISQSDVIHLSEEAPHAWAGWVGISTSGNEPNKVETTPNLYGSFQSKRPIEWGRYTKAIQELLRVDLQSTHEALAKTHNLEFEIRGDGWGVQILISLPKEEQEEYFRIYEKFLL